MFRVKFLIIFLLFVSLFFSVKSQSADNPVDANNNTQSPAPKSNTTSAPATKPNSGTPVDKNAKGTNPSTSSDASKPVENSASNKKDTLAVSPLVETDNTKTQINIRGLDRIKDKDYSSVLDDKDKFNIKNPVFLLSEGVRTNNYEISARFCNTINLFRGKYNCLVYPVEDKKNLYSYLRRGIHSDVYETTGVNGDFLIIRSDIYKSYLQNKGYLKDNIQWVHKDVNILKRSLSMDRLLSLCKKIIDKNSIIK